MSFVAMEPTLTLETSASTRLPLSNCAYASISS